MFKYKRVCTVDFDFCQLGMQSEGYPVKKRTRIMTNSPKIANRLARFQRNSSHWHIPLMNGRASACQVYPRKFCAEICLGLKEELASTALGSVSKLDTLDVVRELLEVFEQHPHDNEAAKEREYMEHLYSGREFFDDVHGKALDKDLAIEARRLELECFHKMCVYTKVPRSQAGSSKVITTKWIDTDKGHAENPNYRARLVGREIKTDERLDLFAATPP